MDVLKALFDAWEVFEPVVIQKRVYEQAGMESEEAWQQVNERYKRLREMDEIGGL